MSFRYGSLVLFFLGAVGVAGCSGDDSAALPLPEAGATPTGGGDGAAREGGSVDASAGGDGGISVDARAGADAEVGG